MVDGQTELVVLSDHACLDHDPGHPQRAHHPESVERLRALLPLVEPEGLERDRTEAGEVDVVDVDAAIAAVHSPSYRAQVAAARGRSVMLDPDTGTSPGTVDAATTAVRVTLEATRRVVNGASRRAFALVRPPGHHARPTTAMGFCVYANAAIAIEHALSTDGIDRVMVLDWDVHHGNGTQEIFEDRGDVLVCDLHQAGHWPGSGAIDERGRGEGLGATINCPLPPGSDDDDACAILDAIVTPAAARFEPDLLVVCAGFDAHRDDPLGELQFSAEGFGRLAARARAIAERHAGGRLLLTLEGGYELAALRSSVEATIDALRGDRPMISPVAATRRSEAVIRAHRR